MGVPDSVYYNRTINDNGDKTFGAYGVAENPNAPRVDFYALSQSFVKNHNNIHVKVDNKKVSSITDNVAPQKGDSMNNIESCPNRVAADGSDIQLYQMRCPAGQGTQVQPITSNPRLKTSMPCIDNAENAVCEKDKKYRHINYQYVEQSIGHQSIVSDSVSIVNDHVSASEAEGPPLISVPLGWRRILSGTTVIYISPSGSALGTLSQLREYLQTTGTCKCGLPCPLRPENTFSFDPKVGSKPYQTPTGPELAKLCNHKRKLLATLQARGNSSATPPPQIDQKKGSEIAVVTKKVKRRSAASNVRNQLVVQKEKPTEYKNFKQDGDQCRARSPVVPMRVNSQSCPPAFNNTQHLNTSIGNAPENNECNKTDYQIQRPGSHYLTVNSGWINPESTQKPGTLNLGQPVIGTNGQIIGVNTGTAKGVKIIQPLHEHDLKDEKKVILELTNHQLNQTLLKQSTKDDESQVFCGLNQALTPEVMQKINEQQQIFIQQNQKQIELAMKGFRPQMGENSGYGKSPCQNNYIPQGHVVIQNGTVVKTNPKTPPWQVKRCDAQPVPSPSPKLHRLDDDYDEGIVHGAEDTSGSSSNGNSFNLSPNNEQINQSMCSRVPPLPQHYTVLNQQQHWPTESPKKKKKSKKKALAENKNMTYGNNGMRILEETKRLCSDQSSNNPIPSFMDDPNGYLAQQTALLNNTISRQVGMNHTYEQNHYENSNVNYINNQIEAEKCKMTPQSFRSNLVPHPSPSPNSTPDSSVLPDKIMMDCCNKACTPGRMNCNDHYSMRRHNFPRQNVFHKMDSEGSSANSSPKNSGDENPVTSSTYIERGQFSDVDSGVVSTSHVSERIAPSPTPSNSSRSTDTPHAQCTPSPAHSNPPTPGPAPLTGPQLMHFISNHNVNKNLMEVGNISLVGVKPGVKKPEDLIFADNRKRPYNMMPGYCPPPHLGGGPPLTLVQASYVQSYVTTMAAGFSVTRDTITSVLAGKAQTATTSINASTANFIRLPPPPSVNLATSYAIPNNQPDPFINSVNLPTSYPLHIAGTTAQNMISKSPLEMVQNVIGSLTHSKCENRHSIISPQGKKSTRSNQILISSSKQLMISSGSPMPPPPPKVTSIMSPTQVSAVVTNVTASISQVGPTAGNSAVHTPTVVVNTLPAPFVLQPSMMVDNQVVQQNNVLPQIVTGGLVTSRQSPNTSPQQIDIKTGQSFVQGMTMLSPEGVKKKSKKKKNNHTTNVTNVLQITAPQQSNIMVHHTSPQHNTSPQFSPRGFQLSPNNNINSAPMLQALTIVPGKSGTPHIVMSGQGTSNNFGSQQIIQNTSPSQQINLLQPVNLLNNTGSVMSNFPTFQQFIVPNIGGMMMTTDGTIIQDNSTGVQLQLQTVNGQNVLTPVQNSGVFAAGTNTGVVIRTQNQQGKIIQSQHSPGAQFLSPNSQVMVNSPNFNSQLSPLLTNLSPTNVTYQNPHQIRSNVQQDFIQTNQMGQTVMVPLSPKSVNISTSNNRNNQTFVQQNTTIVQQQTTLVSNPHTNNLPAITQNIQANGSSRLSIDPNMLLSKQVNQIKNRNYVELLPSDHGNQSEQGKDNIQYVSLDNDNGDIKDLDDEESFRHSVSTQTFVNVQRGVKSPTGGQPDTTTHSPLGALEASCSPRLYTAPQQHNYADTTTKSPEPNDNSSLAMVQCVSSSEQDMADQNEHSWPGVPVEYGTENDAQNAMSNVHIMRHHRGPSRGIADYNQTISVTSVNNQQSITITPTNYYDRHPSYKRKNEFSDQSHYRQDKIMRTNYSMVHGPPKDMEYDTTIHIPEKSPPTYTQRHYMPQGNTPDGTQAQKRYDRHNLGAGNDTSTEEETGESVEVESELQVGQLVWGPVKGYASWPGKLLALDADGRWTVRWFGADKALGLVPPGKLLTLTQGLEAHHAARTKHRKSRKLNINLENAIQEAMAELDKKSEKAVGKDLSDESATAEALPVEVEPPKKQTKKCIKSKKVNKKSTAKLASGTASDGPRQRNVR